MKTKIRILVADDHSIVRRGVKVLLESRSGWQVCAEAATGRGAVRQTKMCKPDVVVLDITMPDLSGLAACAEIVKVSPRSKVLILSMHESEQAIRDALAAGARGYVSKSDLDRDLLTAVDAVSAGKTFFGPNVADLVAEGFLKGDARPVRKGGSPLTPRQREVARLLAAGKTNKEVASTLNLSAKTVETHRNAIMHRLDLHAFSDLVRYAIRQRMIEP